MTRAIEPNLWHTTCRETVPTTAPGGDRSVDLAIIGGGFTGAAAALEAAGRGASVCLLEAQTIGHGGSGRNVGLVNAGLWLPADTIIGHLGKPAGERLIEVLGRAPDMVFGLIERHRIDCEATRNGTLHCAHARAGLADLRARLAQLRARAAPVTLIDAAQTARRTGAPGFAGALFDARAGTIQPLAYARGLARAAAQAGASILEHSRPRRVALQGGAWRCETDAGTVSAKHLLLATNAYHAPTGGLVAGPSVPLHYFQIATAPLPEAARARILPGREGCWDTALVMSSFRLDAAGRLIVGGIGNGDGPGGSVHHAWARRKLGALFPWLAHTTIAHAWTGRIAVTGDHIPRIARIGPGALACYGYSGRGIGPGTVFGTLAARALLDNVPDGLPVAPVTAHRERFVTPRAAWYEIGATLTHAIAARRR